MHHREQAASGRQDLSSVGSNIEPSDGRSGHGENGRPTVSSQQAVIPHRRPGRRTRRSRLAGLVGRSNFLERAGIVDDRSTIPRTPARRTRRRQRSECNPPATPDPSPLDRPPLPGEDRDESMSKTAVELYQTLIEPTAGADRQRMSIQLRPVEAAPWRRRRLTVRRRLARV